MKTVANPLAALALAGLAAAGLAAPAQAGGFYLQEQGVRGTGRAYSGEVADAGVESVWWNPAAIARSGREAYAGAYGIFVDSTVSDRGSTVTYPGGITAPSGGEPRAYNPIQVGLVPNLAVAIPVGGRFAVGVSTHAPFDFASAYRSTSWPRYDALKSRLNVGDLQLTGAMKVNDWLDVGLGADAQYADANLINANPNLSPLAPDGQTQLKGHGWDWGWNIGAQAHLDRLTLGASYRSSIKHRLDGRVSVSGLLGPLAAANMDVPGKARFTTPWIATLGARYQLTDKLALDAQAQRIGWSEFDTIEVRTPAGVQSIPQGYRDVTSGGVGLDYAVNPDLTLRAGVQYDPTPTPDLGRTARVPDSDRWIYGLGASAKVGPATTLDAAFAYVDFKDGRVDRRDVFYPGTPAAVTSHLQGEVSSQGYVLALGVRQSF